MLKLKKKIYIYFDIFLTFFKFRLLKTKVKIEIKFWLKIILKIKKKFKVKIDFNIKFKLSANSLGLLKLADFNYTKFYKIKPNKKL